MKKKLFRTIISILRVIKRSYFRVERLGVRQPEKQCFILGNGPSLDVDLTNKTHLVSHGDVFCVNSFASTDLYIQIQPKYYIFADIVFWADDASDELIEIRVSLFKKIVERTTWPLKIFIPFDAGKSFKNNFSVNHNIQVTYYNNVPLSGFQSVVNKFMDWGLGMPSVQNVLIPAISLAIRSNYKSIIVLGADHSWHETIELDDANRVCVRDIHFYNKDAKMKFWSIGRNDGKLVTMDHLFLTLGKVFEGYWIIKRYSDYRGAVVYNASSTTFIDAFPRLRLDDIAIPHNYLPSSLPTGEMMKARLFN